MLVVAFGNPGIPPAGVFNLAGAAVWRPGWSSCSRQEAPVGSSIAITRADDRPVVPVTA